MEELFNKYPIATVLIGVALLSAIIIYPMYKHDSDVLSEEFYVTLQVDYCNGISDTTYVYIKGDPKYLHIRNETHSRSVHLAVPELRGYNDVDCKQPPILLNVCNFKIITSQKIK